MKAVFLLCLILLTNISVAETIFSDHDVRKYNLGLGKKIFSENCIKCHDDEGNAAPQFQKIDDWETRLKTPVDTLVTHAVNGHGEMPPKGGFEKLSDREVSAAVAYVVDQARRLIIKTEGKIALNQNDFCIFENDIPCTEDQVNNTALMGLIWLLTNQKPN